MSRTPTTRHRLPRLVGLVLTGALALVPAVALVGEPAAAEPQPAPAPDTCVVTIQESTSPEGFTHPGVGLTRDQLITVQQQVAAQQEPWWTYYQGLLASSAADREVVSSNASSTDPGAPASRAFDSQGFNSRFIADGLKAYTQSVLWVVTGDTVHRDNALQIIRIWEQMDPGQYEYFTDSHIHTGIPLNRMVMAAEILRYSSCEGSDPAWTEADTTSFTDNLITPVIETFQHDQNYFMNQHNYPLLGAMAGYIFTDDTDRYAEAVEWFTVNSTAKDQGFNGSVSRLFRLVEEDARTGEPVTPRVQHVEMGRDQAHGGGDITNSTILARMLLAQQTRVDPVSGTISEADDAVGPYEFLDDRILAAADYFWRYMQGYDTDWAAVAYAISPDGTVRDTYDRISTAYRGRYLTAGFWDLHDYYTYQRGVDLAEVAPYFDQAYRNRTPSQFFYEGEPRLAWDNVDGGGDFWLWTPPEAAADPGLPTPMSSGSVLEIEDRYTTQAGEVSEHEGETSYVGLDGTTAPARIAFLNAKSDTRHLALRVRTEGQARLGFSATAQTLTLPDTGGQWRWFPITLQGTEMLDDLVYLSVEDGAVDLDSLDVGADPAAAPSFAEVPDRVVSWTGQPLSLDLSAAGGAGPLQYSATGLPAGAELDPGTGELSWLPNAPQRAELVVQTDDGSRATTASVTIEVAADRHRAVLAAGDGLDRREDYESASREAYDASRRAASRAVPGPADTLTARLAELVAADADLRLLSPRSTADGSLDWPSVSQSTFGDAAEDMVDGDPQTQVNYQAAEGLSHTIDFGADFAVSADRFDLRGNIFEDRVASSAVFGSDDGRTWTRLTPEAATMTQDLQTLEVAPQLRDQRFRMIRVQLLEPQPDVLYATVRNLMELTEFHIHGERFETDNALAEVSLTSEDAVAGKIAMGERATVQIGAREDLAEVRVQIMGRPATVTSDGPRRFTATAVLDDVAAGEVYFTVEYTRADGSVGGPVALPTDGSTLLVAGDAEQRLDVTSAASVTASHPQWPGGLLSETEVAQLLFDRDPETVGDLTSPNGYYQIDLGAGRELRLSEALALPRQSFPQRLNGTVLQGSDDGQTWTDLTAPVNSARAGRWSLMPATDDGYHRYLRLTNSGSWNGNVAELEVYGQLRENG